MSSREIASGTPPHAEPVASHVSVTARFAECVALAEHCEPMTDEQKAERLTLIAREYARREARLQPSPQLDLDAAA